MKDFISYRKSLIICLLMTGILIVSALPTLSRAATITIVNLDSPGEGFNDTAPFTPVGGNPATTLGEARLNAFQHAADIWGNILDSNVEILVGANFDPLDCSAFSGILGSAGANTIHINFAGAPVANTWYPQALANALNGNDLSAGNYDIGATFNSNLNGAPTCLGGLEWYYGFDSNPGSDFDFVSVVLHEIGHGLGFQTFVNLATGIKLGGVDDTYMLNLEHHVATPSDYPSMTNFQRKIASISDPHLHWTGANVRGASGDKTAGVNGDHVQMYGPNPLQLGSSVSHFNTAVSPNELMEPSYTGPNHLPGLAVELLLDISWQLDPEYCSNLPIRIMNTGTGYSKLQDAYDDAAVSGDTIQSREVILYESPIFDMDKSVSIDGGFDCSYADNADRDTTLIGTMTISDGVVTIGNYVLE